MILYKKLATVGADLSLIAFASDHLQYQLQFVSLPRWVLLYFAILG